MSTIVLRSEMKEVTGDAVSAMLLNQLCYWSVRVTRQGRWFYKSCRELSDELCGLASESTIRRKLKDLVDKGLISEEKDRGGKWDRTIWYRVNESEITKHLKRFGKTFGSFFSKPDGSSRHGEGSRRHGDGSKTETSVRKTSLMEGTDIRGGLDRPSAPAVSTASVAAHPPTSDALHPQGYAATQLRSDEEMDKIGIEIGSMKKLQFEIFSKLETKRNGASLQADMKPFPFHKFDKVDEFLSAQKSIGGAEEVSQFFDWVITSKGRDWLLEFGWREIDLFLVFCRGAVKEWRIGTGRVKSKKRKESVLDINNWDEPDVGWS